MPAPAPQASRWEMLGPGILLREFSALGSLVEGCLSAYPCRVSPMANGEPRPCLGFPRRFSSLSSLIHARLPMSHLTRVEHLSCPGFPCRNYRRPRRLTRLGRFPAVGGQMKKNRRV